MWSPLGDVGLFLIGSVAEIKVNTDRVPEVVLIVRLG